MSTDAHAAEEIETLTETSARQGQLIMPFYLLCDVSGSMYHDANALSRTIDALVCDIQNDPVANDLAMLSIITFNHQARTIVPLSSLSKIVPPQFSADGGTNYSAAFTEYHAAFERDRAQLKNEGAKVYRPCVFFLTDGEPGDESTYLQTFKSLLGWDPETQSGNKAFPYFVPYGFRNASPETVSRLAYPDFGPTPGRWFLSRSADVEEVLRTIKVSLGNTVLSSAQSASHGRPMILIPTSDAGSNVQFGEAGDLV